MARIYVDFTKILGNKIASQVWPVLGLFRRDYERYVLFLNNSLGKHGETVGIIFLLEF